MATATKTKPLGELPTWDLDDFYSGPNDPKIEADFEDLARKAEDFEATYKGKLGALSGDGLAAAIGDYEVLGEGFGRLGSFAQLLYAQEMTADGVGAFYQSVRERATVISTQTLFFSLELNQLETSHIEQRLNESAKLARYRPWIENSRAFKPFQLSEELENYMHEASVAGDAAWVRLFDETFARLRFPFQGEEVSNAVIMDRMSSPEAKERKEAALSFSAVLSDNVELFAHITNTLAKSKQIDDGKRGFARPVSSRNLGNQVEDEVVDALVKAVGDRYPNLTHRYYGMKAKWFGVDKLPFWDRNAPLPERDDRLVPWDEASQTVLDAYGSFSPKLRSLGQQFFDNAWIDAPTRPGKSPGAFAHPTVPSVHPYLLLNYQGKTRDVMTLAHELGHGVHQLLAGNQGALMSSTPLTLAETASVFGEMLTFRSVLASTTDPKARKVLLAGKVEDMLNTVVRQIAFHQFETAVHDARSEGELSVEALNDIWLKTQENSLGPVFEFGEPYAVFWSYIPHFIHSPFYVYAYAFGDCLVNSLYAVYQDSDAGFAEKYLDMLEAGGTKGHRELLAPFGLDATDPGFWTKGLAMIEGLIDELEQIA